MDLGKKIRGQPINKVLIQEWWILFMREMVWVKCIYLNLNCMFMKNATLEMIMKIEKNWGKTWKIVDLGRNI